MANGVQGEQTALQKHLSYFDPDNDGVIWPIDTFNGLRALNFPLILTIGFTTFIHLGSSIVARPAPKYGPGTSFFDVILSIPAFLWSFIPDPFFRIYIDNARRVIHGSDTRAYDTDGNFVNENFEKIFANCSSDSDSISFWEALIMIWNQRSTFDFLGPIANTVEWGATWVILNPADGRMKKEDIKTFYDGSGLKSIAAQFARGKKRGEASPTAKS